jgi:hypothetical protein
MRRPSFVLAAVLALVSPGCAEDEDLSTTPGGDDTGGGVSLEASAPDSSVPEVEVDTSVIEDSTVADTGSKPDTFATFDTAGIDIATIDTAILDGFVGPECKSAAECPGADLECAKRECVEGRCRVAFVAPDTPITTQVVGDCKIGHCNGAGLIVYMDDFTDTPAAMGECTIGVCSMMGAGVENKSAGTTCSTGYCDGAGKCVECVAATTCPGTDSDCRKRACVANKCAMSNLPDGSVAATQVPGDCKITLCDGAGATRTATASTDVPVDGNPCTQDVCTGSVPSNPDEEPGVSCSALGTCNGEGQCVECTYDEQCPYVNYYETCRRATCVDYKCGTAIATGWSCRPPTDVGFGICSSTGSCTPYTGPS